MMFLCKNLDNIISRPQRTVQNNKKKQRQFMTPLNIKFVHLQLFVCPKKMSFTGVIELSLVRAWFRVTMSSSCQLSQTQKYFVVVVSYNVILHGKCSEDVVSCQFGTLPQ